MIRRAIARTRFSKPLNSRQQHGTHREQRLRQSSPGSDGPATSSSMRPANVRPRRLADLQPKAAQDPAQAVLDVAKLRSAPACAPSAPRGSPAPSIDLQCTGRNQPSRISCAIPRASLRSDFTGIALNASRTCRVSRSSTARPACLHRRIKPLRQRTRFQPDPLEPKPERTEPGDQRLRLARHLGLPRRSCRSRRPRTHSSIPMTRQFLHNGPWSSLHDAWSEAFPDSVDTINVRDDRPPSKQAARRAPLRRS